MATNDSRAHTIKLVGAEYGNEITAKMQDMIVRQRSEQRNTARTTYNAHEQQGTTDHHNTTHMQHLHLVVITCNEVHAAKTVLEPHRSQTGHIKYLKTYARFD